MLPETERAYIAGILDGEGSISLVKSFAKRTRGRYIYPMVRIANTDEILLAWICERIKLKCSSYKTRMYAKCKRCHHVAWACGEAIRFLHIAFPYLVIKKDRARLVMDLWEATEEARRSAGGYFGNGHPLPEEIVKRREIAFAELQSLNSRGVRHPVN